MATRPSSRLASVATDVRPLHVSVSFRRLWIGNSVAQLGQQMTAVTIAKQVYAITHSSFSVGLGRGERAGATGHVRALRRRGGRRDGPAPCWPLGRWRGFLRYDAQSPTP